MENQEYVSYILPIRDLEYLSAGYMKQLDQIRKRHEAAKDIQSFKEIASGISEADRLTPICLTWLYHGDGIWDGPRKLTDMIDFGDRNPEEHGFADHIPNLVCVNELKDYERSRTELRELFQLLGYRKDKKGLQELLNRNECFQHISQDTLETVSVLMHAPSIWKNRKKYMNRIDEREEYNMCQALEEMKEDIRTKYAEEIEKVNKELKMAKEEAKKAKETANHYLLLLHEHGIEPLKQ